LEKGVGTGTKAFKKFLTTHKTKGSNQVRGAIVWKRGGGVQGEQRKNLKKKVRTDSGWNQKDQKSASMQRVKTMKEIPKKLKKTPSKKGKDLRPNTKGGHLS